MADAAFGFKPVGNLSGAPYNGQVVTCVIPASDGTATFTGDFVKLAGDADTTDKAITVIQAAAGDRIYGCIVGFEPDYSNLGVQSKYRAASTKRLCRVALALPGTLFVGQADGAVASADVGLLADIVVGTGSSTTGRSAMEIDISTKTTGSGQLQIVGLDLTEGEDIDTAAAGTNLLVYVNESVFTSEASGV